jgi:hypothetical protein
VVWGVGCGVCGVWGVWGVGCGGLVGAGLRCSTSEASDPR